MSNFIIDNNNQPLRFNNAQVVKGNARSTGSQVLFRNVTTINGQSIDALVSIDALRGMTVNGFDSATGQLPPTISGFTGTQFSNGLVFNLDVNQRGSGDMTLTLDFIVGGSYNPTTDSGTPVTLQNVILNSYDIDGVGGAQGASNGQYQEYQGTYDLIVADRSNLRVIRNPSSIRVESQTGGNINDGPGTRAGDAIRIETRYRELSELTFTIGGQRASTRGSGTVYFYLDFSAGPNFSVPTKTISVYGISGTILEDLDNDRRIDNPGDTPFAGGVTVRLLNNSGQVLATKTTDALGNYRFDGLENGRYTVEKVTTPPNYVDILCGYYRCGRGQS